MTRWLDMAVFIAGVATLGVGVALKDPACALMVVGAIASSTVVAARILSRPQVQPPKVTEGPA